MPLLEVKDLHVRYGSGRRTIHAVQGVSLSIDDGEIIGLVGESGCGKSSLGRALIGLERIHAGDVVFQGRSIQALRASEWRNHRRGMQMVFQDPMGSLNPRMTIGETIEEVLRVHRICPRAEITFECGRLLESVGLSQGAALRYPHEFSGGQRQRIGLARALALRPKLILADEPVSALDVSVQVQILNLMKKLREERGLAFLLIAHDLAVVRYMCRRVHVMQRGVIVENGEHIFEKAEHPYTRRLLAAVPGVERGLKQKSGVGV